MCFVLHYVLRWMICRREEAGHLPRNDRRELSGGRRSSPERTIDDR